MGGLSSTDVFLFEGFRLDRASGGLFRRDADGVFVPVAIGSRALEILAALVERRGEIVPKEEIMGLGWPRTAVVEGNLFVQIAALRRILDAAQSGQSCIQTVIGRGYRFIAPVTRCAAGMDQHPRDLSRTGVEPSVALVNERLPEPQPSSTSSAERRQVTVMICDLVGATTLAARLDPEDLHEIIAAYHRAIADIVGGFDGLIGKYMSEGVIVYFGYPRAHEDDAERAVRAGLRAIDAVGSLDVGAGKLQARVGIATGLVVVGDPIGEGPPWEQSAVGEAPHLAAGLQALARPDTVIMADSTRRQTGALFEIEDLGRQPLAGFAEPQRAWRVIAESSVLSRFEALRSEATPLIGRDEELDLLLRRWQQAKVGDGRIVLVSGEPGIGKSRLTAALSQRIESDQHTRLRYFCSPYHQDSALYPFIVQLERAAGFARGDTTEQKLGKFRGLLAPGARGEDEIELLAELLSLPNSVADLKLSPQRKREKLFEALLHQLEALALAGPVLMIFEDAHWIDPTSRELLDLTFDRVSQLPILLIVTFRLEFQHGWSGQPHVTAMALNRLGGRDGTALVERVAGNAGLSREIIAEIVERADGVPLFVEELTKAMLETGDRDNRVDAMLVASPRPNLAIPATLHASLIARLDRLGPIAKEVGQIGAVLGREFGYVLIELVSQQPDAELRLGLDRLGDAGLVFCRGVPPQSSYLFKHALVQDAAYGTLLRGKRQELHRRVASVLEQHLPETAETQPELLAHHCAQAGWVDRAIAYYARAGQRAVARSAMAEAIAQLTKGLELLTGLPDAVSRQQRELELQIALGRALIATRGYAAPEVGETYIRARILCERLNQPSQIVPVLFGQWVHYVVKGQLQQARLLATEVLRWGEAGTDAAAISNAYRLSGVTCFHLGELSTARAHLKQALARFDPAHRPFHASFAVTDFRVNVLTYLSLDLFCLGYLDRACVRSEEAIEEARQLQHSYSIAHSLSQACWVDWAAHSREELKKRTGAAIAVSAEHCFPYNLAVGTIFGAWAMAASGQTTEGIALLREGLAAYQATGAMLFVPFFLTLLADAQVKGQHPDEALGHLAEAECLLAETDERWAEAELYRVRGELLCADGDTITAEGCFRKAISVARQQRAKFWELRAATSFARLRRDQARRTEARDLLAPVYGWFTEGFDTPDLKKAKALLDELA
jgi:class 3 adenylate cyclase/predicted ATPase